jgi:tubulin--tyrosine ligase
MELQRKDFEKETIKPKHCEENIWIVKPDGLNQGRGITMHRSLVSVMTLASTRPNDRLIVQKYIEKPLLYQGRKFDVRVWALVTPAYEVFFYEQPYMRTASKPYSFDEALNPYVHITNNTLQKSKKNEDYERYEPGNTLPLDTLKSFLSAEEFDKIIRDVKKITADVFESGKKALRRNKHSFEFELFGLDFLID